MAIGVAVIGCGLIGNKRIAALPQGTRLVSVTDLDRSRAEKAAAQVPYEVQVADSAEEAVAADGADLAVVAVVHADLAAATLVALEAGCHVLVEKPGGRALEDLEVIQEGAARSRRRVRVGFNHRFHPGVLKARELLRGDDAGELIYVRARYGHGGRPGYESEWRSNREVSGGGELLDQGMHLIDLTRFLIGDVDLAFVELRTDFWKTSVEDNAYLALRPRAGGFAWLHTSWTEWKNIFSLEIAHARRKIEMFGLGGSYGTERLTCYQMLPEMGPPATTAWEWPQPDRSWARELEDFISTLRDGTEGIGAEPADAAAAFAIVEEAYET
ncbi:MAG: Gfo/Idh/MocA family protein [Actinomycetota bacterium]